MRRFSKTATETDSLIERAFIRHGVRPIYQLLVDRNVSNVSYRLYVNRTLPEKLLKAVSKYAIVEEHRNLYLFVCTRTGAWSYAVSSGNMTAARNSFRNSAKRMTTLTIADDVKNLHLASYVSARHMVGIENMREYFVGTASTDQIKNKLRYIANGYDPSYHRCLTNSLGLAAENRPIANFTADSFINFAQLEELLK